MILLRFFLSVHFDKEQLMKYIPGPMWSVKCVNVVMFIVLMQCIFIIPLFLYHCINRFRAAEIVQRVKEHKLKKKSMRKCLKQSQQASVSYH